MKSSKKKILVIIMVMNILFSLQIIFAGTIIFKQGSGCHDNFKGLAHNFTPIYEREKPMNEKVVYIEVGVGWDANWTLKWMILDREGYIHYLNNETYRTIKEKSAKEGVLIIKIFPKDYRRAPFYTIGVVDFEKNPDANWIEAKVSPCTSQGTMINPVGMEIYLLGLGLRALLLCLPITIIVISWMVYRKITKKKEKESIRTNPLFIIYFLIFLYVLSFSLQAIFELFTPDGGVSKLVYFTCFIVFISTFLPIFFYYVAIGKSLPGILTGIVVLLFLSLFTTIFPWYLLIIKIIFYFIIILSFVYILSRVYGKGNP